MDSKGENMRRFAIVLSCFLFASTVLAQQTRRRAVGIRPPAPVVPPPAAGAPLAGLSTAQTAAFNAGRGTFNRDETAATGLGPVFNQDSCGECHSVPAIGGGGNNNRNVTRIARRVNGGFDPLTALGGSLIQNRAIGGRNGSLHNFVAERVPAEATIVVQRRTTPIFGLGLVDATPDADFIALAAAEAARGDGVAGRVNMTDNIRAGMKTVGKFGWKAQVPTLFQFAGDALLNEMGITNPDFPDESCPQGNCAELAFNPAPGLNDTGNRVTALHNFMMMLAAPPRAAPTADSVQGEQIFEAIGCAACHVSTLRTGSSAIAALDHQTYHPYSDFLLHDMGSLGDGLEMASSSGAEARTEPLWGLRFVTRFLHDGRATTLEQAISAHDGQARAARDRFSALAADAKAQLLAFLRTL
jgi:CxxC motif-containing protein (DUF1111 family)